MNTYSNAATTNTFSSEDLVTEQPVTARDAPARRIVELRVDHQVVVPWREPELVEVGDADGQRHGEHHEQQRAPTAERVAGAGLSVA